MPSPGLHDHDLGLQHDLSVVLSRRAALGLAMSAAAVALDAGHHAHAGRSGTAADDAMCVVHPPETAGPFPGNGSNALHGRIVNVLDSTGIVRRDMRTDLGPSAAAAAGTPIDLTFALAAAGQGCAPLAGYAVYLWHCDAEGRYSLYDVPDRSYLRAVGIADARGEVHFTTIFPGCYPGRYTHLHYEVYASLGDTANHRNRLLTSQLAFPADACRTVYGGSPVYKGSMAHFAQVPAIERDFLFRNNTAKELSAQTVAVSGAVGGLRGRAVIGIAA